MVSTLSEKGVFDLLTTKSDVKSRIESNIKVGTGDLLVLSSVLIERS